MMFSRIWILITKNTYKNCNVRVSVGLNKIKIKIKIKDYSNVQKITYKQCIITISIESKIYKYVYIFMDSICTNL
jgi:hypothetical protein